MSKRKASKQIGSGLPLQVNSVVLSAWPVVPSDQQLLTAAEIFGEALKNLDEPVELIRKHLPLQNSSTAGYRSEETTLNERGFLRCRNAAETLLRRLDSQLRVSDPAGPRVCGFANLSQDQNLAVLRLAETLDATVAWFADHDRFTDDGHIPEFPADLFAQLEEATAVACSEFSDTEDVDKTLWGVPLNKIQIGKVFNVHRNDVVEKILTKYASQTIGEGDTAKYRFRITDLPPDYRELAGLDKRPATPAKK